LLPTLLPFPLPCWHVSARASALSVFRHNRKPGVRGDDYWLEQQHTVSDHHTGPPYPGITGSFQDLPCPSPACCFFPFYGIYPETGKSPWVAQRIFPVARARQTGENEQIKSRRRYVKSGKAAGDKSRQILRSAVIYHFMNASYVSIRDRLT